MTRYLLDSGLVIRHIRGQKETVRILRGLGQLGQLSISAVTRIEIHAGIRSDEQYRTQKFLSRFITYDVDRGVADRAGDLIRKSRSKGSTFAVPDAIIAATALLHNLTLVTLNKAHFEPIDGLSLYPLSDSV